jgi:hypothetical protein
MKFKIKVKEKEDKKNYNIYCGYYGIGGRSIESK